MGITFFSGILGIGHHYYWEGYSAYWLWIGGIFSASAPFVFLGMTIYAFAMMADAIPATKGSDGFNKRTALTAFWLMVIGMSDMTSALFGAGMVQSFMERYNNMPFMVVQDQMWLFYAVRLAGGVVFTVDVLYFIKAFFQAGIKRAV